MPCRVDAFDDGQHRRPWIIRRASDFWADSFFGSYLSYRCAFSTVSGVRSIRDLEFSPGHEVARVRRPEFELRDSRTCAEPDGHPARELVRHHHGLAGRDRLP